MKDSFPPRDDRPSSALPPSPSIHAFGALSDRRPGMVDERLAALAIRRVLDRSVDDLPGPVAERLATARSRALARVAPPDRDRGVRSVVALAPRPAADGPSLRWRLAAVGVSLGVLVAVSALVDSMQEEQSIEEMAEVNNALVTDDLPLDAYADRGFGVFLMNTRAPQAQAVSLNLSR